ncbi:MAG: trigger factor [Clostridiales Family XIII bacterium]|nr:trigger factor [Clostridiales Family XIII bacterium]
MEAKYISRENDDVTFEIAFDADEFENAQIDVYKRTKDKYAVDGFRKGKAPRSVIERRYGEGVFLEEAIDVMLDKAYPKSIVELALEPIDQPRAEFSKVEKKAGFTVTFTVAVEPQIEVKDYTGIVVKEVVHEVKDDDVQRELELMQFRNARTVDVDRPAINEDTVNIDYEGWLGDEQFEGGTAQGYDLKLGSGSFIPGFEDQLIGARAGDKVDVNVTFPEEYHSEALAGKDVVFHVTVHSVKGIEKPDLDDAFAQDASEFETLDELKADLRAKLETSAKTRAENDKKNAVLEAVFEANKIDLPDAMVESTMDSMTEEFASSLRQQGMDFGQYLNYYGQDPGAFRESLREDAVRRSMMRLIVKAVAEAEGLDATDAEVEAELSQMASQYGIEEDRLKEILGEEQFTMIRADIRHRKAVDFMYETAVIEQAEQAEEAAAEETVAEEATAEEE